MKRLLAGLCCALLFAGCDDDKKERERTSENHEKKFRALDEWMERFIAKYDLPGGAIAVTSHGRLVHAQGFGFSSPATQERFKADTLARVGSFSKLVTAASVLKLVEQGKLQISDPVFGARGQLSSFDIRPGADPKVRDITVRNFLTMTSGWDPEVVRHHGPADNAGSPCGNRLATARATRGDQQRDAGTGTKLPSGNGIPLS